MSVILDWPQRLFMTLFTLAAAFATEGRHVLLFRAGDQTLEIIRILHSSMDLKRHLPPERG